MSEDNIKGTAAGMALLNATLAKAGNVRVNADPDEIARAETLIATIYGRPYAECRQRFPADIEEALFKALTSLHTLLANTTSLMVFIERLTMDKELRARMLQRDMDPDYELEVFRQVAANYCQAVAEVGERLFTVK